MAEQAFTPLSNTETAAFCSQMAMILRSGISTVEGISLMLEDTKDPEENRLLTLIEENLQNTGNFQEALAATGVFPAYMLHMVQIGEYSGRLDEVMEALTVHYNREADIAQSIKNAVTYPLIMVFMMLLVILVLVTRVMPIFDQVFRQLGSEMTGLSRAILDFGTAINRYSIVLSLLVVFLALLVLYFGKTKRGREHFSSLAARLGWMKTFAEKLAVCRFASGMSLTLSSGINPEECLSLASQLTDNEGLRKKLEVCREALSSGSDFSHALLEAEIFSGVYARMVSIGSKTGSLDNVMRQISDQCQDEIDQQFTNMISILEPTLVIVLSVIVGMILLSVMLPLTGIMSNL